MLKSAGESRSQENEKQNERCGCRLGGKLYGSWCFSTSHFTWLEPLLLLFFFLFPLQTTRRNKEKKKKKLVTNSKMICRESSIGQQEKSHQRLKGMSGLAPPWFILVEQAPQESNQAAGLGAPDLVRRTFEELAQALLVAS